MKSKIDESTRLFDLTTVERRYWPLGMAVGGMDEVGRGPLAGPVVAAAVILPSEQLIEGINDSKKLTAAKRIRLDAQIRANAVAFGIGWVSHEEVDSMGILPATHKAFRLAYEAMASKCDILLMDALTVADIPVKQIGIVHGDATSYLIGAASIVAKVARDAFMTERDSEYPMYGFASNMGYGTRKHIDAIKEFGPCPYHRRSFIKNFYGDR